MPSPRSTSSNQPVPDRLAGLLARVEEASGTKPRAATTRSSYERGWEKWEAWCRDGLRRPVSPLTRDPRLVALHLATAMGPHAKQTLRQRVYAICWGWERAGIERIKVTHPDIAAAITDLARTHADQTDSEQHGARALAPETWAEVLDACPPTPPDELTQQRQAAVLLGVAAGVTLGASSPLLDVTTDDVHQGADVVTVAVGDQQVELACTVGPVSPGHIVARVAAAATPGTALFDREVLSSAHRSAGQCASRVGYGSPAGLTVPLDEQLSADDALRTAWHLDFDTCRWLREQLVLVLQVLGGWRPTDLALLKRRHVVFPPGGGVVVHLPWHKGRQTGDGSQRTLPSVPDRPDYCPVTLLRLWIWLLGLGPDDPLLPPGTGRSISRSTHEHTPPDAARGRFKDPIKTRAAALGIDDTGLAATTGRHTVGTTAVAAGVSLVAVANHLDHARLASTEHYLDRSDAWAAATQLTDLVDPPGHTTYETEETD